MKEDWKAQTMKLREENVKLELEIKSLHGTLELEKREARRSERRKIALELLREEGE